MNHYETVFIITPLLTDEQVKEVVSKYKDVLKNEGSKLIHEENWGLRKLAYPINKKSTGFYQLLEHESSPEFIEKLDTEFRRDERIMRFLNIKLDKYGIEYNTRRRKGEVGKNFEKEKQKQESI